MLIHARVITACIVAFLLAAPGCAQQKSAIDDYNAIAAGTKLDREGARPFHLKMETQLYDLKGKPTDTGTIETWWLAPDQFRIEMNSGDVHMMILTGEPDQVSVGSFRSAFLLRQLLSLTVNPLYPLSSNERVSEADREINGHKLSCFVLSPQDKAQSARETTYCREPGGENVRLTVSPDYTAVRNRIGTFGSTNIALDVTISYMGHPAISGKVDQLQVFDAAAPGSPKILVSKVYNSDPHIPSQAVVFGHYLSTPWIEPPLYAKHEHLSGVVLVACSISREGKVSRAEVIATSNDLFDDAAVAGVQRWLFTPFTFKGQPVAIHVLLHINFVAR